MRSAVVTGSSSGIGLATATELVQRGYSVVLHGHQNLSGLELAASSLHSQLAVGAELHCITADVSCDHACRRLVQTCFHWHSKVDLWVNNAGADVLTGSMLDKSFEEKLGRLWQVDVLGTVRLSRMVAQRMAQPADSEKAPPNSGASASSGTSARSVGPASVISDPPCIINVGWDQAFLGMEGDPGQLFCTAKAAVLAFTSALSLTVAPQVRVNAVSPGWIRTAWGEQSASSYWANRAIAESQLQRWGTPQDVAEVICWLGSHASGFVTGQNISVNGGRRFYSPASPTDAKFPLQSH